MGRAFEVRKASMQKTGVAKTKIYTKFSKEIYMTAKAGNPDIESNLALKHLVDKAKKNQVPADIIKRAIDKAKTGGGEDYQSIRYEGFGPQGSTIIVDCLTDNVNRTISDVKNCFTKTGNKLGVSGSVAHMYTNAGIIETKNITEDEVIEALIENDVEVTDIETDDNLVTIYVNAQDLHKAKNSLITFKKNIEIINDEIAMLPQIENELSENNLISFNKLITMLNEVDDVQEIYHSVVNI